MANDYYKSGQPLQVVQQTSQSSSKVMNTEQNLREDSILSLGVASAGIQSASGSISHANATAPPSSGKKTISSHRGNKLRSSPFIKEIAGSASV